MRFDYCVVVVVGLFLESCIGLENITTGCAEQPECVRCGPSGCARCRRLIVQPTRACVHSCPFGHVEGWSTAAGYVGRVCRPNGRPLGLSADALAVLVGALAGVLVCALIVSSAVAYLRCRRKRRPQPSETASDVDDGVERRQFQQRLDALRPHAPAYLDLLNDARRQIRRLHADADAAAVAAYRPAVRDLAKMLLLLNRRSPPPPDDWERLLGWAEQALRRCRRLSEQSQPSPSESTCKAGSEASLRDLAVRAFDANYDAGGRHLPLGPHWRFEYCLVADGAPASEFDAGLWRSSKEGLGQSLFLEDDFCQLGFRPQDEITTEL